MTEKEAREIARKAAPNFPFCRTLEKGENYVFLFSGLTAIPNQMIVAVMSDGRLGASIIGPEDAKKNARR